MKITIDVPTSKATPDMEKIIENVVNAISTDNLRIVDAKLKKLGPEKLNSKLKTGLNLI